MFRLDNKVVAVIGAGGGIGEAVALAVGAGGAHVACFDINHAGAALVAEKIRAAGGRADGGTMDLNAEAEVHAGLDRVAETHGRLDGLVCTPAVNVRKPILRYTLAEFDKEIAADPEIERNCHRIAHMIGAAALVRYNGRVGKAFAEGSRAAGPVTTTGSSSVRSAMSSRTISPPRPESCVTTPTSAAPRSSPISACTGSGTA